MRVADWDEDLSILSAENVHFGVETAGLGSRLAAIVIDGTLQLLMMLVFGIAVNYIAEMVPDESITSRGAQSAIVGLGILITFLILYGYYFLFEWLWSGQTPGKRVTGLRVLQTDGSPVTLWPALIRNLLRIIDFLPLFYGVGAVVTILNPQNRRAGDLVAGTVVAREKRETTKEVLDISDAAELFLASLGATTSAPTPAPEYSEEAEEAPSPQSSVLSPPTVDPAAAALRARLSEQDYEMARDFLSRRETLAIAARERLALTMAARLAAKLGEAPPQSTPDAENMLETITQMWRRG